jgi:hypothetical protein
MKTPGKPYPSRLPASIKGEAERLAAADGVGVNQFAARKGKVDRAAYDRIMKRPRGENPRPGDEMPDRS